MSEQTEQQFKGQEVPEFSSPMELIGKPNWMYPRYMLQLYPEITDMFFSVFESSDSATKERHGKKLEYLAMTRRDILADSFPVIIERHSRSSETAIGVESVVRVNPYQNLLGETKDTMHILLLDYDFHWWDDLSDLNSGQAMTLVMKIQEEIKTVLNTPGFISISSSRGLHFLGTRLVDYEKWLEFYDGKYKQLTTCEGHHYFSNQTLPDTNIRSTTLRLGHRSDQIVPEILQFVS